MKPTSRWSPTPSSSKENKKRYIDDLQALVHSYNHSVHSTTSSTPARAMQGKYADIVAFRIKSKVEGKIEADKRDFPDLEPGDKVRIS